MSKLSLNELLDSVGISKVILAKLMDVSRSTVTRMGDDVSDDVLAVINKYKADMTSEQSESVPVAVKPSKPIDNTETHVKPESLPITHENIAKSRIWYGRDEMPIDQVAGKFGLSVFDYNQAVQDTVIYCQDNGTSFMELRA